VTGAPPTRHPGALHVAPAIGRAERRAAALFHEAGRLRAPWGPLDDGMTLLAWEHDLVVGCIGISRPRGGCFRMEDRGVPVPAWLPRSRTGEVSRWAALTRHGLRVQVRLAEAAALWMRAEGLTHAVGLLTAEGHRRLERAGLPLAPLGEPTAVPVGGRHLRMHPVWAPVPAPCLRPARAGEPARDLLGSPDNLELA
jgi:hypothetical protein